jgi:hypothetical protein
MLKITITVKEVEYCTFIMAKENLKNKKWIGVNIQEFYNVDYAKSSYSQGRDDKGNRKVF